MATSVFSPHSPGRHPPPPLAIATQFPPPSPRFPGSQRTMASSTMLHGARLPGTVAVFCPGTLRLQIYPVAFPLRVDNAYTAELYTAWVALSARGPCADPTFTLRSSSWRFAEGYITAQEMQREPDDSLQGDLIRECRALADGQPPPGHLYSHITRTWLDALLDQVDAGAARSAESCSSMVGWLTPIHEPRICFSHAGLQVHDALPHPRRALLVSHHTSAKSPPPQRNPALIVCTTAVSHGLLSWGNHLAVTGLRLSLFPPGAHIAPSASYQSLATTSHLAHLTLCSASTTIGGSRLLSKRCHAWCHCAPTAWGFLVLWGNEPFLLAADGSLAQDTLRAYTVWRLGAISPPHRDALQHQGLCPASVCRLLCDVVLTTVLLHKRHAVPIPPLADHYSPQKGDPVDKSLVDNPPPEWYHVTNWSPTPRATKWPAWDVILSLWLSGDLLLAPEVKSTITTR